MKSSGLFLLIALFVFGASSCAKKETIVSANSGNSTAVDSKTSENSNQKSEPVSAAEIVRLKPSEPCGWFEESLKMKAEKYEASPTMPDLHYCTMVKPLINQSNLEYHVVGDAENIRYLYISVHSGARNDIKQDAQLQNMLPFAAQEILDKTSGQKLSEEILNALLMGETKDFTLEASADKTKPQIKTVSVEMKDRDRKPWKFIKSIKLEFYK